MKLFCRVLLALILASPALAGLPPTTSKGSGDTSDIVTFKFRFPNFLVGHSGSTVTIGNLKVAGGGTGSNTFTVHSILLGEGTGSVLDTGTGTLGQILQSNGASLDPAWGSYFYTTGTSSNTENFWGINPAPGTLTTGTGEFAITTFDGAGALTSGVDNTYVGLSVGAHNDVGNDQTGFGWRALAHATGNDNTCLGMSACTNQTTGDRNTFVGSQTGSQGTGTGSDNTAIGEAAMYNSGSASQNTAVGREALVNVTTSNNNTGVGYLAGQSVTTGHDNTFLGANTDTATVGITNATAVGSGVTLQVANSVILGSGGVNVGVDSVTSPTARLHLPAVTTSAGSASLKINSGTIMTSTEHGAVESDGTHLYWTNDSGSRINLAAASPSTAMTVQQLTSSSSGIGGYLFTVSTSTTLAIGDTYTNNGVTFTSLVNLTAQSGQVLWMSSSGAPLSSGTLTRATGSGTASLTFTSDVSYATYTKPAGVLYIKVRMVGAGGGGGGSSTGAANDGGTGTAGQPTFFGVNLLEATGGGGGAGGPSTGGAGGSATVNSPAVSVLAMSGATGQGSGDFNVSGTDIRMAGGAGASSLFGGAGPAGAGAGNGGSAIARSGSGGGGGGTGTASLSMRAGSGGGSGAYVEAIIGSPSATYPFIIPVGGAHGAAGTSGNQGGDGGSGIVIVEEHYQ
jgi:hypothetical protein